MAEDFTLVVPIDKDVWDTLSVVIAEASIAADRMAAQKGMRVTSFDFNGREPTARAWPAVHAGLADQNNLEFPYFVGTAEAV